MSVKSLKKLYAPYAMAKGTHLQKSLLCSKRHINQNNFYAPDSTWPQEALDVYEKLVDLTARDKNWTQYSAPKLTNDSQVRPFLRCTEGKTFTGAIFFNNIEMTSKAVITFQNWSQGGPGFVHGGLVATLHDSIMAFLKQNVRGSGFTAYLNVNYKVPLLLLTTVLMDVRVVKIENRKTFLKSTITSLDGDILYSDASSLFLLPFDPDLYSALVL